MHISAADRRALMSLMFERRPDPDRIEHGLAMLQAQLPSFVTGVHGYLTVSYARHALFAAFDAMPAGLVVFDSAGVAVFGNRRWDSLLTEEPEAGALRGHVALSATWLLDTRHTCKCQHVDDACAAPTVTLTTRLASYVMEAFFLPEDVLGEVYVAVHICRRVFGLVGTTRTRYRLSRRECDVAVLLIEGKSNKEIAEGLFLSVHTVRRHVEAILKKTHCATRSAVATTLLFDA
jgi:DNA-binding CsgD family transcriptional regulator